MLSLRQFAEQFITGTQSISLRELGTSLGVAYPISLRYMLEGKIYYELTLESLTCIKTESLLGPDHCRLEVFTDGGLEMSLRSDLAEQQTWLIQRSYLFTERSKIKLWDEDWPDSDDLIATVFIEARPGHNCTVSMTGDDAAYQLLYDVTYRLLPKDFDPALNEIALFEQSDASGVWPYISKSDLIADIKNTISTPLNVRQDHAPLCGPTAIVYELVARNAGYGLRAQKKRYVQLCRMLWETGHIKARSMDIRPSDDLRNSPLSSENGMSPGDWMLIASLRDAENLMEDIEGEVSGFEGYTFPGAMKTWIFEILGFDEADWESCWLSGEIDTMKKAQSAWDNDGVAFLTIDSNLLKGKPPGTLPDHWVAFQGELELNNTTGMISFKCYSWGKIISVSMTQEYFSEYLFGVVLGER